MPLEEADIVIRPLNNSLKPTLSDLFRYRRTFFNLLTRDLRRQYVDLKLGFIWTFSQPVLMTLIFAALKHGSGARVGVDIPYTLYLLSGCIFWFTWVDICRTTTTADRINAGLISKVFFPRLYSPLAAATSKLVAYALGLIPILILQSFLGLWPSWTVILLPAVLVQGVLLGFSVGVIFAILSLQSRDWDRVLGQILYLGLFVSPVVYSPQAIPEKIRTIYKLNPMAGVIEAFRASLIGQLDFPWVSWGYSCCITAIMLLFAVYLFKRTEARLLDEL